MHLGPPVPILLIFDEQRLAEHHGDATPGSALRIPVDAIEALHAELSGRRYPNARPAIAEQPWGRDMAVLDRFGNRLVFSQALEF